MLPIQYYLLLLLILSSILCFYWMIKMDGEMNFLPRLPLQQFCLFDIAVNRRAVVQQLVAIHKQLEYAAEHNSTATTRQTNQIRDIILLLDPLHNNDSVVNISKAEVCPESYKGPHVGWVTDNCSYAKPLSELIEVLLYYPVCKEEQLVAVLIDIHKKYPFLKIHVALDVVENSTCLTKVSQFVQVNITKTSGKKPGLIWNQLATAVATSYVLVGRHLDGFETEFPSLERQIRMLETVKNVQVVGGAFRNRFGHWSVGCFQVDIRNYVLTYKNGYSTSRNECMFCDHLLGPFVTRTTFLMDLPLNDSLPATVLFEDWFLKVRNKQMYVMNCPDVMYLASDPDENSKATNRSLWRYLARQWELNSLTWPPNETFVYNCTEVDIICTNLFTVTKNYMTPLCCLEDIRKGLRTIDQFLSNHSTSYVIFSGAVLGGVKMADFLPWDLDFDLVYNYDNNKWMQAKKLFYGHNLILSNDKGSIGYDGFYRLFTTSDPSIYAGYYFEVWPSNYRGFHKGFEMPSAKAKTKINFHGIWVHAPKNPGQYARNRYGREILKHAHSWRQSEGRTEFHTYDAGHFNPCTKPEHHSCLDHFPPDGVLSFKVE